MAPGRRAAGAQYRHPIQRLPPAGVVDQGREQARHRDDDLLEPGHAGCGEPEQHSSPRRKSKTEALIDGLRRRVGPVDWEAGDDLPERLGQHAIGEVRACHQCSEIRPGRWPSMAISLAMLVSIILAHHPNMFVEA